MSTRFIRVPNIWFDMKDEEPFFKKIGVNEFTLWFKLNALSVDMSMSRIIPVQIKSLQQDFSGVRGFSKNEYIRDMLVKLKKYKLIECKQLTTNSKPSDLLNIQLKEIDYSKGFSTIAIEVFEDKLIKIQPTGFAIFCLLYKNHNLNFGSASSLGHCNMSQDAIASVLNLKSRHTVIGSIDSMIKAKGLIKIEKGKKIISSDGRIKFLTNTYSVYAKYDDKNKYFVQKLP
jgi:hypothetical protein